MEVLSQAKNYSHQWAAVYIMDEAIQVHQGGKKCEEEGNYKIDIDEWIRTSQFRPTTAT
jgi:hypothetical protein